MPKTVNINARLIVNNIDTPIYSRHLWHSKDIVLGCAQQALLWKGKDPLHLNQRIYVE